MKALSLFCALLCAACCAHAQMDQDTNIWLEDVTGAKPLDWVRAQNSLTTQKFEDTPDFKSLDSRLLAILNSRDRIPYVEKHGKYYYNFWRDQTNPRGLWRRTTLAEYKKARSCLGNRAGHRQTWRGRAYELGLGGGGCAGTR